MRIWEEIDERKLKKEVEKKSGACPSRFFNNKKINAGILAHLLCNIYCELFMTDTDARIGTTPS